MFTNILCAICNSPSALPSALLLALSCFMRGLSSQSWSYICNCLSTTLLGAQQPANRVLVGRSNDFSSQFIKCTRTIGLLGSLFGQFSYSLKTTTHHFTKHPLSAPYPPHHPSPS